ncbi:uncharacterized protein LOC121728546 [Aricia agestis]|uniref:uncharacterized protein LOC121728546 n=1 Tax=Aricia agestis TaxID=91739 RepID=UPI001C203082|nr:uncharacterized protein LOC121728546 [Aricia agestis]
MYSAQKDVDPELLMKIKFKAKCQFRALGRLVLANTYWLSEDVDQYEGVDNVKLRVQQAVRSRAKKKQLLSVTDKALLNKPAGKRTDKEKKYIYRIIGGLKCFKRYPNHVKKQLAAVTYFKYYGPGRVIVRQHHEAHALYFIISGEVSVTQLVYDDLLKQHVSVEVGVMHAGDMFGEVSLLHNIPRTATCTTTDHCELLVLMKDDFKNVLQASVQKQWDEVQSAMAAFTYFDSLDEVARREGCIVAKMKSYDANETILGDGVGVPNFVYFVLSGRCQMIESLQMFVEKHLTKTFYTLHDPYVPVDESDQDFETKYFGSKKNNDVKAQGSEMDRSLPKEIKEPEKSILKPESAYPKRVSVFMQEDIQNNEKDKKDEDVGTDILKPRMSRERTQSVRISTNPVTLGVPQKTVHTYFMQVCIFNTGSTFGFGENMRDRRIVALTPVTCMLLPKIWLLQRNTANIWSRIQHYLEKKIPTKKQLFKEFVLARKWEDYKEQIVEDVVARANAVNWTTVHDVPYSIRMEEMLDI